MIERVVVDGAALELARWPGQGPAVLLLHEGLGSVSAWGGFPARLAAATGRPVIAWSRRGHGGSDPLAGAHAPDYMHREAEAALRLLDSLGLPAAHWFGHSDGASIALIAAARAPARVLSLILEAPHVFVEDLTIASIARIGAAYAAGGDLPRRLARHHRDAGAVFQAWNSIWLDPAFRAWSIEALLPGVRAPALLIQGADDEYGTMAQLDRIEAGLGGAQRLELAGAGHAPHRDRPGDVLAAVCAFLAAARTGIDKA